MGKVRLFPLPTIGRPNQARDAMRRLFTLAAALACALQLLCVPATAASSSLPAAAANPAAELSAAVTQITGIAISPLMGIGGLGAVKYMRADASTRAKLPWYAQPWFFVPALALVAICFLKDSSGVVIPTALKKPLDLAEVFENKLSGLIATGAIVPLAFSIFHSVDKTTASLSDSSFAAIDLSPLYNTMMVPVALAIYAVVWVVSHTTHILILLSPFGVVDTALKSLRTAVLGSLVASHWINDSLGLLWAGIIILICALLAGWAFRLLIYGNTFAWDLVTFHSSRFKVGSESNVAFLAQKTQGTPIRTCGTLSRNTDNTLTVRYRPWLVLPSRSIVLPAGRYAVGRGVLHPTLIQLEATAEKEAISFPPRCSSHEAELATQYGAFEVRDTGIRAAWSWLKSSFTGQTANA